MLKKIESRSAADCTRTGRLVPRLRRSYSYEQICQTLRSMEVRELLGEGYIPNYTRTDLTDDLRESFGFRTDYDFIPKDTMKKIITSSQKRKKQEKWRKKDTSKIYEGIGIPMPSKI